MEDKEKGRHRGTGAADSLVMPTDLGGTGATITTK